MNKLSRTLGLFLLTVFFFQCQKDLSYIGAPDTGSSGATTPDPIKAILQGNIVDENNQPAAGVSITVGANTAMTNGSGYFRITDASLDKNTSLVVAQKAGYFKGYRVFSATSGTNQVVIKLVKRNLAGTLAASSGGSATLANGAIIKLPANGVVVASSGTAYLGDVNVYAAYIDPKANDIAQTIPGSFVGDDKNGKRVVLSSYGMLAVELESAAGEKLQIKPGVVATLTTPIPARSLSSAPTTISMWYVDEITGVWKEEGTATKQGNNYVGDVKHFSFWNCDRSFDGVYLSLTLKNEDGLPLANVAVEITDIGSNVNAGDTIVNGEGTAYGYTDSLGQVKGFVPANKKLLLQIVNQCGIIVYSKNISPLSQNTDLGTIVVTGSSLITFKGTLLDCNNLPVKKGYAIISVDNFIYYAGTDANGQYAITFYSCSVGLSIASVLGVDETLNQQSATTNITVAVPVTNAGNISTCGTSSVQYINYTLDGTDYSITTAANDSVIAYSNVNDSIRYITIYGHQNSSANNNLSFYVFNVLASGTYPVSNLLLQNFTDVILTQPFNVTFTKFAIATGEFYEGTLSGKFTAESLSTVHTLKVTFKVRRNN